MSIKTVELLVDADSLQQYIDEFVGSHEECQ